MTARPPGFAAVADALQDWADAPQVRHVRRLPERSGETADWPEWVSKRVRRALAGAGVARPWRHQVTAAELARAGRHVVLTTGTASGKSLGFLLPVLAATYDGEAPPSAEDPAASAGEGAAPAWSAQAWRRRPHTALYLSPTKALAHDQLRSCSALDLDGWLVAAADGDSAPAERDWARDYATFVLTNPDLVHYSLLPNHARWAGFLQSLRYVVVDEAHRYSGVFGAQVAAVLRRLRRLAAHYGGRPVFILASATVANAEEAAAALLGVSVGDITAVGRDASARGPVEVVLRQPEGTTEEETAVLLAQAVAAGRQTIAFVASRRNAELVAARARTLSGVAAITSYRAGYLAEDRRRLEQGLRDGSVRGVAATNALELGVDIAGVDTVLLCGYPGTRSGFWQQAGRAGRRGTSSQVVLVGRRSPLDAYVLEHPEVLLDQPVEATVLHPENPYVLGPQLAAAAQELPLTPADVAYFGPTMPTLVDRLATRGLLRRRPGGWFWPRSDRAANAVDLRAAGGRSVEIVEKATGRVLGHVDAAAAEAALHPGAVYLHLGDSFLCEELDLAAGEALVRSARPGYLTQPQLSTGIAEVSVSAHRRLGAGTVALGEVDVHSQVTGYLRRDELTGHVWDETPLDLPGRTVRATAVWWTLDSDTAAGELEEARLDAAVHAAEHVCVALLPIFAPCDYWDIGVISAPDSPEPSALRVYVHDRQPGGTGFAEHAYQVAEDWLAAAAVRVRTCDCAGGCPACVISASCGSRRRLDKPGAARLLELLVG